MLESELIELVNSIREQKCENNYIEIKSAETGCPKIFDTLSSFSNQPGGGKIVFGINESDNYNICGVYDAADLQKKITEQSLQMDPEVRPLCTTAIISGKTVVCAEIQEIDNFQKPCFYRGKGRLKGSYIRVGDADRVMTEYEVYSYEAFKKKIQDELRIVPRADLSDIATTNFLEYKIHLMHSKPNLSTLTEEKIQKLQGFIDNDKPTLAGIMLFSEYPQAYFPQLCVTAVLIPGTEISTIGGVGERFIDNERIEGTIVQMLKQTLAFIRRNMKTRTIIDTDTGERKDRPEYPIAALREIILNALIHRDYSIHTDSAPISIRMFSDRIEIENPGGLYGRMTLDMLGKMSSDTRNPFLAGALEVMNETENRYSGIPTIINSMKEAELPAPKFENDRGVFRVTLYNNICTSSENINITSEEEEILEFCNIPRSRTELESLFNDRISIAYLMTKYIHPMIEKRLLGLTIPDKPRSKNQRYYKI